jgi:hypothetical protein
MSPELQYRVLRDALTFPVWTLVMSGGACSKGICGVFRPRIPLTDLSDLEGDALVGDDWPPCPEVGAFVDALTFLRAGFKFDLVLVIGVGIRLLSSTFGNLGIDVGVVGAVLMGGHWRVGGVEGSGGC